MIYRKSKCEMHALINLSPLNFLSEYASPLFKPEFLKLKKKKRERASFQNLLISYSVKKMYIYF